MQGVSRPPHWASKAEATVRAHDFVRLPVAEAAFSSNENDDKWERAAKRGWSRRWRLRSLLVSGCRYSRIAPQYREMVPDTAKTTVQ